jgi:tRNA modification GTPase
LAIADLISAKPAIAVLNKVDLLDTVAQPRLEGLDLPAVTISALTGQGLQDLEDAILEEVFSGSVSAGPAPVVTSPRHKAALSRALDHVESATAADEEKLPLDLVAIDVSCAINAIGEITGQTAGDDLLETIFGRFCIGK